MTQLRLAVLAVLAGTAALAAACNGTLSTPGGGSTTAGSGGSGTGTTGPGSGGSGAGTTSATTGGSGGAAPCATCTADQWCNVFNPCEQPPYACIACQQQTYCGADDQLYPSECAAFAATGQQHAGAGCAAPSGTYWCNGYACDAASDDCVSFDVAWHTITTCVPCATLTGRACGDDGNVYADACALVQAGHRRGTACPGFVHCGWTACDTTISHCAQVEKPDCQGGTPASACLPGP